MEPVKTCGNCWRAIKYTAMKHVAICTAEPPMWIKDFVKNMEELPNPKLGDKGYMVDMRADATDCPCWRKGWGIR